MPEVTISDCCRLVYEDSGAGPPLLFVHGWAMSGRVWRYQREALTADHRVITLDFRGHGASAGHDAAPDLDDFAADIATVLNRLDLREVTLVAWSMGVSAALRAFPGIRERLAGLVLVGGTPRFTRGDGFRHGLPPEEVRGMTLRLRRNYGRTMEEFFRGMFAAREVDSDRYRQIVQEIVKGGRLPEPRTAIRSLESLAIADQRPLLPSVDRPALLIHGLEDRICLPGASRFMAGRIAGARLELLPGLGHAPFLSRPDLFNRLLRDFTKSRHHPFDTDGTSHESRVTSHGFSPLPSPQSPVTSHQSPVTYPPHPHPDPLPEGEGERGGIDRQRVSSSFHCHSGEYERHARVQRRVVERIMGLLRQGGSPPRSVLDIGCGTGMLLRAVAEQFPDAALAGIDLAPGMVAATRAALAGRVLSTVEIGDAEQLPFPAGGFELVVSTSTFQWLEQLSTAFAEVYRVLAPGGSFRFALFGSRTLFELKESYRSALERHGSASGDRTHRFLSPGAVATALGDAGFSGARVWSEDETESHPDVPALLRSLKRIGAGNASPERVRNLAERRIMLTMMQLYRERYGREGVIPATYEVIYGEGVKEV